MLCRLLVLRHAKSSEASPGMTDHERPLNEKGVDDAKKMGKKIAADYKPRLVLCSDAKRTMETWAGMSSLFADCEFEKSHKLYLSNVEAYLNLLSRNDFDRKTMMIVGHNPTVEELVLNLSGKDIVMKPAHLAVLETKAESWPVALSKNGYWKLVDVITP